MTSELKPCPLSGELLSIASNYRECLLEIELQTLVKAAQKLTRAAPDVHDDPTAPAKMEKYTEGEYVRYDQAAAIIAAKDAENERLREALRLNLSIVKLQNGNLYDDINQIIAKGEAALNPSEQRK